MRIDTTSHKANHYLLHEDGSTTLLSSLTQLLVAEIKGHGHFGNVTHHVAGGNWEKVASAVLELLVLPTDASILSPVATNLVTMLDGKSAANLLSFRTWLLDHVESQTTNLYRRSLARRLDGLEAQIRAA